MLQRAFVDYCLSKITIFNLFKKFIDDRESIVGDLHSNRPSTLIHAQKIDKVR